MEGPSTVHFCSVCGSPIEQQEAFGQWRPVCTSCGYIHFHDPKVAAAVFVEKDGKILLIHRVITPHQGKWTLPAGFVDAGEDPADAAVRECLEETGVQIRIVGLIDVIAGREHPRGADIVILYRGEVIGGEINAQDDADAAQFFGPDELPPLAFRATDTAIKRWLGEA